MSQRRPEEFRLAVQKVETLYSTPQVLAKAMRMVGDPDVDLADMAELVRRDASLSADLLHLSNSALYSRGEVCTDLHVAVQRLGLREVLRAIGLSLSKNIFGKGLVNYGITSEQYWGLSVLAGLLMESLARRGLMDADSAYLVGILHAIGRVLINEALPEVQCRDRWDGLVALETWELEHIGFTHAEAGALLLGRWGFPGAILQPIAGQFGPPNAAGSGSLTGLLRLTLILLKSSGALVSAAAVPDSVSRQTLTWAGFRDWEELQEMMVAVSSAFDKVKAGIGPGS